MRKDEKIKIKRALYIARDFMRETIEECDHSVGICWCKDRDDLHFINEILVELEDK